MSRPTVIALLSMSLGLCAASCESTGIHDDGGTGGGGGSGGAGGGGTDDDGGSGGTGGTGGSGGGGGAGGGSVTDARADGPADRGGDASPTQTYEAIVIVDTEPRTCTTTGPGPDLDAVELYDVTGNTVLGVGLRGSVAYEAGTGSGADAPCADTECPQGSCKYSNPAFASRVEGPEDGEVMPAGQGDDVGYFSINKGKLLIQFGDANGNGSAKRFGPGQFIRIYEIDKYYVQEGSAPATCTCPPERYEVWAYPNKNDTSGAVKLIADGYEPANSATCGASPGPTSAGCGTTDFEVPGAF